MTPIRIAVIGAGVFGTFHADLLAAEPDFTLVGIVDPTAAGARLGSAHGVPAFADVTSLLDAVRPEAAVIASPNQTHSAAGTYLAGKGVHLLVEKPIADTCEAGESLIEAADRAGVALLVGHHRRFDPVIQQAKRAIEAGELGRVVGLHAFSAFRKPDSYFDVAWRTGPGGGTVLINVIHDIDVCRYLLGEVTRVQALFSSVARRLPVEDSGAISLGFAGGAVATILCSDAAAAPWSWEVTSGQFPDRIAEAQVSTHILGTAASLAVPTLELWRYEGARDWQSPFAKRTLAAAGPTSYVAQARHFRDIVRNGTAPLVSGRDALATLRTTLAIHRSAETGEAVRLPV